MNDSKILIQCGRIYTPGPKRHLKKERKKESQSDSKDTSVTKGEVNK